MNQFKSINLLLALVIGAGAGSLYMIAMQRFLNAQERTECTTAHHRRLIHLTTVMGDTYHCVPAYFFQPK